MLFGKKGEEIEMTTAILKEKYPEVYNEIDSKSINLGKKVEELTIEVSRLTMVNTDLNSKLSKYEEKNKIISYATKLKIKEENYIPFLTLSFNEAVVKMVDLVSENLSNMENLFKQTGSISLGLPPKKEDNEPKDFGDAITMISKRDKISVQEALPLAQKEFSELFNKIYKEGE